MHFRQNVVYFPHLPANTIVCIVFRGGFKCGKFPFGITFVLVAELRALGCYLYRQLLHILAPNVSLLGFTWDAPFYEFRLFIMTIMSSALWTWIPPSQSIWFYSGTHFIQLQGLSVISKTYCAFVYDVIILFNFRELVLIVKTKCSLACGLLFNNWAIEVPSHIIKWPRWYFSFWILFHVSSLLVR